MTKKPEGDDWFDSRDFRSWAEDVHNNTLPGILDSAYVISIAPTKGLEDVKLAVEIGFAILLDKPLIVFAPPGRTMSDRLLRIADHVITGDINTPEGREEMFQQMQRIMSQ